MNIFIHILLLSNFTFSSPAIDTIQDDWFAPDMENAIINVHQAEDRFIYGKITQCDQKGWIGEVILRRVC